MANMTCGMCGGSGRMTVNCQCRGKDRNCGRCGGPGNYQATCTSCKGTGTKRDPDGRGR